MSNLILVYITCKSKQEAASVGKYLLEKCQVARGLKELKEFTVWVSLVVLTIALPFVVVPRLSDALFS